MSGIPVLFVQEQGLAAAWEHSILALRQDGCEIRTEYDAKDSEGHYLNPPSKDSTMLVTVLDPASEPFYHRAFPGGLADLQEYSMEVLDGIKDHWMYQPDPTGTKWKYTYHDRLTKYNARVPGCDYAAPSGPPGDYNQIEDMVQKLAKSPHSRRAQAITWKVWEDTTLSDPPCLQSIWCRVYVDADGVWWLCMNVRFRSRDAYDAAFMNMVALIALMERIAKRIGDVAGCVVRLGRYCDMSDSYHIYGTRLQHCEDGFMKLLRTRTFEDRTWTREFAEPIMQEAIPLIRAKVAAHDAEHA